MIVLNNNTKEEQRVLSKLFKYKEIDHKHRTLDLLENDLIYLANGTQFNDIFEGQLIHDSDKAIKIITLRALVNQLKCLIPKSDYEKICGSDDYILSLKRWIFNDSNGQYNCSFDEFSEKFDKSIKPVINDVITNFISILKELTLISCFSEENDNSVLWGNYAKNNTGICIEYNFYDVDTLFLANNCYKVEYLNKDEYTDSTEEILQISELGLEHFLIKPFTRKTKIWSNEHEWRIILPNDIYLRDSIKHIGKKFFIRLPKPRKVFIGADASDEDKEKVIEICKNREISVSELKIRGLDYVQEEILIFPQGRLDDVEYVKECLKTNNIKSLISHFFLLNNLVKQKELLKHVLITAFIEIDNLDLVSKFLDVILFKNEILAVSSYYYFNVLLLLILLNEDGYFTNLKTSDGKTIEENLSYWLHICVTKFSDIKILKYLLSFEKLLNCFYTRCVILDEDNRKKYSCELNYSVNLKYIPKFIVDVGIGRIVHPIYDHDYNEFIERNILKNLVQIFNKFYCNDKFDENGCKNELNRIEVLVSRLCDETELSFKERYFDSVDYYQDAMINLKNEDSFEKMISFVLGKYRY